MVFKGWQKTSLIEYPDKISTVLFTGGCNFRCPYCYNSELVLYPEKMQNIYDYDVLEYLKNNQTLYQAVIVTGGEPCMQKGLTDFLIKVKELGFLTGTETNGSLPLIINNLLQLEIIDYIAMDIKAPLEIEKYGNAIGINCTYKLEKIINNIKNSIELILYSGIKYEFRTTFVPQIHNTTDANTIAEIMKGNYVL